MNPPEFQARFSELTGNSDPFPWQEELFLRFKSGRIDRSLDIPTGLGKTAVMAIWLAARAERAAIPLRLVYVVDRKAVVDQATEVALRLRAAVGRSQLLKENLGLNGQSLPISTLRGQHVDNKEWLDDPSLPAIIVGTIDMIGSRLLFEGYGVSRKMRPYHAGLLGANTLVVLDEAHLVPPFEMLLDAIASDSARVASQTADAKQIVPPFKLMSLSATGRSGAGQAFTLTDRDLKHPAVRKRLDATKRLLLQPLKVDDALTQAQLDETLAKTLAEKAWETSEKGSKPVRVIVFCNKRKVAEAAKKALDKLVKDGEHSEVKGQTELFVGGRRVREREQAARRLAELGFIAGSNVLLSGPAFVFATSAGEVGVDLDADHMVCDLAEWERMIQRLGRVNRRGEGDAQVIVLVEPDPKPDKAARAALEKATGDREDKDLKAIESHQRKVDLARAKRKPFEYLPSYEDGSINASPGALRCLKIRAGSNEPLQALLIAATTPEPLRPALTRPLVDAWSMTSLKEHTGRPEIGPWLRGWVEEDPQTTVVWRSYLPTRTGERVTKKEIETFFEAAPPHASEALEAETFQVFDWLLVRAEAIRNGTAEDESELSAGKRAVGIVLSPSGDLRRSWTISDLLFESDDKRKNQEHKDEVWKSLAGGTLVLDARIAGLRDGMLDATAKTAPVTADAFGEVEWLTPLDGEPIIRFRVRSVDPEAAERPIAARWRPRYRFATSLSEEGGVGEWLVVEKWGGDSSTEDDRAIGSCQLLTEHQERAENCARKLAKRLSLTDPYVQMLAVAARRHDEGKKAVRWQRAFNAPDDGNTYAKTPGPINMALLDGYRHEFSSLAAVTQDEDFKKLPEGLRDLALHLIAAHHGFGRPVIGISGCEDAPPSKLAGRAREVALRFARLQRHWGPWGLAWWESLLRAADQQASRAIDPDGTLASKEAAP